MTLPKLAALVVAPLATKTKDHPTPTPTPTPTPAPTPTPTPTPSPDPNPNPSQDWFEGSAGEAEAEQLRGLGARRAATPPLA